MQLTRTRIRIKADAVSKDALIDIGTGRSPAIWRGTIAQVEIGLFQQGVFVDDLSGIESITLEIRPYGNRSGTAYISKTVAASQFDAALTADDWDAGERAHCIIPLDESDTNLPAADSKATYWLVIAATLADGMVTVGAGALEIVEDGAGSASTGSAAYYTPAQSDARYMRRSLPGASYRTTLSGEHLQLWDPDANAWRTLLISGGSLALGPAEPEE